MTGASTLIEGKVFLLGDDVNTDIHCSSKYLPGKGSDYVSTIAFDELSSGLAKKISVSGGILVAGKHFGINSSREQAVEVLRLMNVKCIIAESFRRQFFRNAINNGLPVVECDTSQFQNSDHLNIHMNLGIVENTSKNIKIQTQALPSEILKIIEVGGLIPFLKLHPNWEFVE